MNESRLDKCLSSRFVGFETHPAPNMDNANVYRDENPTLRTLNDVTFMPTTSRIPKDVYTKSTTIKYVGGLYDNTGKFIPESALWRGVGPISTGRKAIPLNETIFQERDEEVLYLGFMFRHFGHFLTESLTRVWAVKELGWKGPVIFHASPYLNEIKAYQLEILDKMGIDPDKVEMPRHPMRFRKVHIPAASMAIQSYIYDIQKQAFEASGHRADRETKDFEKVYVSRAGIDTTRAIGELELEQLLAGEGFKIVRPEIHSIDEQIRIFNSARIYVGCLGSAMHNLLYATQNPEVIFLCRDRPINKNYLLIDSIKSFNSIYFRANRSEADEIFRSGPWQIDLARVMSFLKENGWVKQSQVSQQILETVNREYRVEWNRMRIDRNIKEKEFEQALELAKEAIEIFPGETAIRIRYGRCLLMTHNPKEALQAFEQVLSADDSAIEAHGEKARALVALGRTKEAVQSFVKAQTFEAANPDVHVDFANLLKDLGRYEEAYQAYRKAIELAPRLARLRSLLARAYLAGGQLDDALKSIEKAIALKPSSLGLYRIKIKTLKQMNRHTDVQDVEKTIKSIQRLSK